MTQDMKRNIQMRNMGFTASKQQTVVQPDLQSGCKEYKDLKSDRCIANADIQSKRIANPLEQDIQMRNMGFTERKQQTCEVETAYLRGGNRILSCHHLRSLLILLLTMTLGATEAWGQTEGLYYIDNDTGHNGATSDRYYLVPADDPQKTDKDDAFYSSEYNNAQTGDPEKPFLTTYKTNKDAADVPTGVVNNLPNNSVWILKAVTGESGFFYIIHASSGKYVVYEPPTQPSNNQYNRKSMHLLATDSPEENAKFNISTSSGGYKIRPKSVSSGSNLYFNPAGTDWDYYHGNGGNKQGVNYIGLVGLYSEGGSSIWYTESTLLAAPTISDVSASNTITITDANSLPTGYTIRYTTGDGTQAAPTATTGTVYSGPIAVEDSWTVKAVVVRYGLVLTNVAVKPVSPAIVAPTVTNNYDGNITLSTTTTGATIYYTTNGDTPDNNSTQYVNTPFSLGNATVIKAIAYLGSEHSEVTTYNVPQYTTPSISFNDATSQVTITSEGSVFYNTGDGSQAAPTTSSTSYSAPFTISSATTVKAIATHAGYLTSEMATLAITQVATPTVQNNGSNAISITCATEGATIYYTTDGSTPTTSRTQYTAPLTEGVSGVTIKAIAVKENMITSAIGSGAVTLQCAAPVIVRNGNTGFTVSCPFPASGVTIYYTTGDGSQADPTTSSSSTTSGGTVTAALPITVKAIAVATNYSNSTVATVTLSTGVGGDGTASNPYTIEYQSDVNEFITKANTADGASKHYKVIATSPLDFSRASAITQSFSGTFDGGLQTISGLDHALFNTIDGGTVKNVILDNVGISGSGNVGAIANEVTGTTDNIAAIYNCGILSGSVSGSGYVGGLVGQLGSSTDDNCYARVINCFSYADVGGGTDKGGIVGYNKFASTSSNIRTMVMNCMFYGDISSGGNISPVYGGEIISNAKVDNNNKGLNNYNYYRYESNYSKNNQITSGKYNCALAAEEKYLTHFELYRLLLNSNKKLAAYYATGSANNANQMAKWVLESADKANNSPKPYPILKAQGKYSSIINYDDEHITDLSSSLVNGKPSEEDRNKGGKLGTLTIRIEDNTSGKGSRTGAFITISSKTLPITDKDAERYNYNYYKVRLPYYNEVGTGNYTKETGEDNNRVVTGWIVTSMTGATPTQATSGEDVTITNGVITTTPYNFADRTCTMDENGDYRVFSQGAYFDVPIGVSAITIKPYWAKAAFLSDKYLDKTYTTNFDGGADVTVTQYNSSNPYTINGISMKVNNSFSNALDAITTKGSTVYDNAIVLVGNFHQSGIPYYNTTDPTLNPSFTVMSADFDNDNEPDFSLIYQHIDRKEVAPIRFDFINMPGTSMAQKPNGSSKMCGIGTFKPYGWFEVTNTTLISFGQFEYDFDGKQSAPLILLGGEVLQIVSNNSGEGLSFTNHTQYFLVGGNAWFKEFNVGTHADKTSPTPHRPISVTGGKYEKFYLSGIYQPKVDAVTDDAECYINGGSFGEVAGAGQEQVKGNVNWIIDYADIDNFYGGGINAAKAITGNINVTIRNSYVDVYCGGPKFGDMESGKTVKTEADGCIFRRYFGAGYGGASFNKVRTQNKENTQPWNTWQSDYTNNRGKYVSNNNGVATGFEYEYFIGSKGTIWGRFYVNYASFSKATTNNVSSELTNCHITGDFYGGGSLGVVNGTAYSTLDGCTVDGSVFGGGYSASIPTVDVVSSGFSTLPSYNANAGLFTPAVVSASAPYKWETGTLTNNSTALGTSDGTNVIYTDQVLTNLGQVNNVDLTIKGNSYVKGDIHKYDDGGEIITAETKANEGGVFGGGDASSVKNNVIVKIEGTSTEGEKIGVMNVYGGGNVAEVGGDTTVTLQGNSVVRGDVFGGGNEGIVNGSATVTIRETPPVTP